MNGNINGLKIPKHRLTLGQEFADLITNFGGSWTFILTLIIFLMVWVTFNAIFLKVGFDPYPFIFLNLFLSSLAAIQAPIILMSQKRQVERDHIQAERDFIVNRRAEREILHLQRDMDFIKTQLKKKKH
ncbi:DUF1003 domain-containing protein [Candidatus Woesearchaeota archaeon]|nr:DUF1003 domain-containing protein [Candidatus Woesearchaeota archaeon]